MAPVRASTSSKIVYVEWVDIVSTDGGWHTTEELDVWIESEPNIVHQIGFVYADTKDYLVLVDSFFDENVNGYAVKIPRGCIIKIERK